MGSEEKAGSGLIFIHRGSAKQKFTFPSTSTLSLPLQVQQGV